MKAERHRKILELISDNAVTTQEELMAMPGGRRLVRLLRKTHLLAG